MLIYTKSQEIITRLPPLDYHHLIATDTLWYIIFVKAKIYSLQGGIAVYLHMKDHYNFLELTFRAVFLFPFKKFRTESHNLFIPETKTDY